MPRGFWCLLRGRLVAPATPPRVPELPFHPQLRCCQDAPLPQTQASGLGYTAPGAWWSPTPQPRGAGRRQRDSRAQHEGLQAWPGHLAWASRGRASGQRFEPPRETRRAAQAQRPLPVRSLRRTPDNCPAMDQTRVTPEPGPACGRKGPRGQGRCWPVVRRGHREAKGEGCRPTEQGGNQGGGGGWGGVGRGPGFLMGYPPQPPQTPSPAQLHGKFFQRFNKGS